MFTVKDLKKAVDKAVKNGYGDKYIIVGNDNEGNEFHALGFLFTTNTSEVKKCIESSNGLYDTSVTDPEKLVILG